MIAKGAKINRYSPEFKDEAVVYWRNSGKSAKKWQPSSG